MRGSIVGALCRTLSVLAFTCLLPACGGGGGGGEGGAGTLQITAQSIAADATGVNPGSAVSVTFSKDLDLATVGAESFRVSSASGPVAGQVTAVGATATFTPSGPLGAGTVYLVLLTEAVKGRGGEAFAATSWHFTTANGGVAPGAPTNLVANALLAPSSISVTWDSPGTGVDRFELQRGATNTEAAYAKIAELGPEVRGHVDAGLATCAPYHYRVRACNAAGCSAFNTYSALSRDVTYDPGVTLTDPAPVDGTTVTLQWTAAGAAPAAGWSVYALPENWLWQASAGASSPYEVKVGSVAAGTHCYWVGRTSSCWSKPVCASVSTPATGTLRVVNASHFDIRSIAIGADAAHASNLLQAGYVVPAGGTADLAVAPGSYYYRITSGNASRSFWEDNADGSKVVVTAGSVTTVSYAVPTLPLILTNFSGAAKEWRDYFLNCANDYQPEWATLTFRPDGSWSSSANTTAPRSGTVSVVEWQDGSTQVKFKLCPSCATITLDYGLTGSFYYANGPSCTGSPWLFHYKLVP